MNRLLAPLALVLALAAAPAAAAEHQHGDHDVQIGFGVGLEPINTMSLASSAANVATMPPVQLYVPIQIGQQLRIEPSFGMWHGGVNQQTVAGAASSSVWAFGVGAMYYAVPLNPTGIYLGARVGLAFRSASAGTGNATTDVKETDLTIAPVLGGEYAFSPRFTVGAEAQLGISWFGNPSTTANNQTTTPSLDHNGLATNAVVFLRYFFN
jgi:Outer membrane protein beta-barrel domain